LLPGTAQIRKFFGGSCFATKLGGCGNLHEVKDTSGKIAKALNLPKAMLELRRSGIEALQLRNRRIMDVMPG
jgi:hypothetical protein